MGKHSHFYEEYNFRLILALSPAAEFYLTLQEAASGMHPSLEAILTQFFDITLIGGQK